MGELLNKDYGYVYAIKSLDLIKVGVAKNIEERMKGMRLDNPHGCELIFYRRSYAPYTLERRIHKLLADKSVGREWFRASIAEVRTAAKTARLAGLRAETVLRQKFKAAAEKRLEKCTVRQFKEPKSSGIKWLERNAPPI